MQHADLLRHGRMTSLEHSTAHLMVDRRALRSALADNAALQRGASVLARLRCGAAAGCALRDVRGEVSQGSWASGFCTGDAALQRAAPLCCVSPQVRGVCDV